MGKSLRETSWPLSPGNSGGLARTATRGRRPSAAGRGCDRVVPFVAAVGRSRPCATGDAGSTWHLIDERSTSPRAIDHIPNACTSPRPISRAASSSATHIAGHVHETRSRAQDSRRYSTSDRRYRKRATERGLHLEPIGARRLPEDRRTPAIGAEPRSYDQASIGPLVIVPEALDFRYLRRIASSSGAGTSTAVGPLVRGAFGSSTKREITHAYQGHRSKNGHPGWGNPRPAQPPRDQGSVRHQGRRNPGPTQSKGLGSVAPHGARRLLLRRVAVSATGIPSCEAIHSKISPRRRSNSWAVP